MIGIDGLLHAHAQVTPFFSLRLFELGKSTYYVMSMYALRL